MKFRNKLIVIIPIIFLFITGLNSCKKEETKSNKTYFVSSQNVKNNTDNDLKLIYAFLSGKYFPALELVDHVTSGIQVHKIVYETKFQGEKIKASGLVCLPDKAGNYPILCFQNGTNVLYSKAPSKNYDDDLFKVLEGVASMGFIVVIPDYLGFGESEQVFHPYLHAESTVVSIIDMIRATKEFTTDQSTVAQPTKDLFLLGYSQGGWATMCLQKVIEYNYPNEFNLVASACGAGPYKLAAVNDYALSQTNYPMPYFLVYVFKSFRSVGVINLPYAAAFNSTYASKIDQLFDGLHSGDQINAELSTNVSQLFNQAYLAGYNTSTNFATIRTAFANNSVAAWNLSTPTRLYHAGNDAYIPISISEQMYNDFKTLGVSDAKIKLITIPGYDHPGGVVPVGVNALLWFLELK